MVYAAFGALIALGYIMSLIAHHRENYRQPLIIIYAAVSVIYLIWRIGYTLPAEGPWSIGVGIAFVALEIIMFIQTLTFGVLFWRRAPLRKGATLDFCDVPTVDVLIATYNEPVDILETTLVAAIQMDYPFDKFNVYLCDDGDRPAIRALAEKWGAHYIRRNDHSGAKAGNLNHALTCTNGEFVVTMDADMILKPQFLQHMVGHFHDKDVAFVQAPQAFHNADVFQHNLHAEDIVRNDQDFFMRFIEPQRDMYNAAIYVGSGAIFRREALLSIGGFVTDVITEDMATGLVLQDAGWKSVFVNEVVATGLAAETYSELIKQRTRWARGNIQVLKKYAFGRLPNLSFAQRWLLFDSVHYWFFGIYRLFFILLPIVVLTMNIELIHADITTFLMMWSLQFMYSRYVYDAITKGRFKTVWTNVYELSQSPQLMTAVLQELIFGNDIGFQVTRKGSESTRARFVWEIAWSQLLIFIISTITICYYAFRIHVEGWHLLPAVAIPLGWMLYNTICLVGALATAIDQPRFRHRLCKYQSCGTVQFGDDPTIFPVQVEALHVQKICFSLPESVVAKTSIKEIATLRFDDFESFELEVETARRAHGVVYIYALYHDITQTNYAKLVNLLNRVNTLRFEHRPSPHRFGFFDVTIGLFLRRLFQRDSITRARPHEIVTITAF
ncbi:MAG: glycosyltransferase [Actinomycetaceae bacterium]|nr:glycosyltransferase [Actinomycetaceae bacterium]